MAQLKDTLVSGSLWVKGDLNVEGSIIQEEVKDLKIKDRLIELASGSTSKETLDGGGIQFGAENLGVFIRYRVNKDELEIRPRISGSIEHAVTASYADRTNWNKIPDRPIYVEGKDIDLVAGTGYTQSINVSLDKDVKVLGLQAPVGIYQNGDVIPSGSSLYSILKNMLYKVLYPAAAVQATVSQKVKTSVSNNSVLEVYSVLSDVTATVSTSNGKYQCSSGSEYPNIGTPSITWGPYTFGSLSWNGVQVGGGTETGGVKKWTGLTLRVGIGTNKLGLGSTTVGITVNNLPKKNTGEDYLPEDYSKGGAGAKALISSESRVAAADSVSVIGVWPCFTNISGGKLISGPSVKCSIQQSGTFVINDVPTEVGSAYTFQFAYPDGYTILRFQAKGLDGNWADYVAEYEKDAGTVTKVMLDGSTKVYHYMKTAGGNGVASYKITLSKTMNN